ncbi:MAG: histidine phosphatase family protein [Ignavibacteriota bacterium]
MKNLILLRHAKSSWKNPSLSDFERPLNKRGTKDAPAMAELVRKKNIPLDLILSSTATRTTETTKAFIKVLDYKNEILFLDDLYLASSRTILSKIHLLDEVHNNILVVCHNPGITDLTNYIGNIFKDNIPTTGIVGFSFDDKWKNLNKNCCKFLFFEHPKKLN